MAVFNLSPMTLDSISSLHHPQIHCNNDLQSLLDDSNPHSTYRRYCRDESYRYACKLAAPASLLVMVYKLFPKRMAHMCGRALELIRIHCDCGIGVAELIHVSPCIVHYSQFDLRTVRSLRYGDLLESHEHKFLDSSLLEPCCLLSQEYYRLC